MKLSEFRDNIIDKVLLVRASIVYTFQIETAYPANNWGNIISTTLYTITYLIFIDILYANVPSIAGYSRNEMLIFFLIAQLFFYSNWAFSIMNLQDLIEDVNKGNLDLILSKPIPARFYVSIRKIHLFAMVRDGIPPTILILLTLDWSSFSCSMSNLLLGGVIFILGLICVHVFQFIAALTVFWLGANNNILTASQKFIGGGGLIPFEGYNSKLKLLFTTLIPILIPVGISTSVILGKSDCLPMLIYSFVITIIALIVKSYSWKCALRNYTSASS